MSTNTTTNAMVGTGLLVTLGTWADDKTFNPKIVVGTVFVAFSLAALAGANQKLADQMALLVFVAALLRYGLPVLHKLFGINIKTGAPAPKVKAATK